MKLSLKPRKFYVKFAALVFTFALLIITLLLAYKWHTSTKISSHSLVQRETDRDANFGQSYGLPVNGQSIECFIFIVILSSPGSLGRRKGIRNTWLRFRSKTKYLIQHRFVIGTLSLNQKVQLALSAEDRKMGDLLLFDDLEDSYQSLTLKLLKTLQWSARNAKAKFLMKADDDSFVRLEILAQDLAEKEHLGRIYWGFFRGNSNVKKAGPWAEKSWYLCDHYLPYALGGGYIISQDLVEYVDKISNMVQLYKSEDVSLGTWLAPVRLNRFHDVRFDTEYKSRGCNNNHIVSHKQSVTDMYKKYDNLIKLGKLCEEERSLRNSFDYNWEVLPSKCCVRKKGIA